MHADGCPEKCGDKGCTCVLGEACPTCGHTEDHADTCNHPDGWHDPMPGVKGDPNG